MQTIKIFGCQLYDFFLWTSEGIIFLVVHTVGFRLEKCEGKTNFLLTTKFFGVQLFAEVP